MSRNQSSQLREIKSNTNRNKRIHETQDVRDSIQKLMSMHIEDNNYRIPVSLLNGLDYTKRKKQSSLGTVQNRQM